MILIFHFVYNTNELKRYLTRFAVSQDSSVGLENCVIDELLVSREFAIGWEGAGDV